MLRGERVLLRARHEADVPVLESELHDDVATKSRADSRPWRPMSPGTTSYAVGQSSDSEAFFTVETIDTHDIAGEALLWGIDRHNRVAHIGISMLPALRGRGLATDVVRVLCHYGFTVLGLHRLQIDTLAENAPMIAVAERVGFTLEGTLRQGAWVTGEFLDEVVLGLLATEWRASG
ncbi:MAG TPA: GNAT family protein [Pseudonocardiaceae bacterium]|jgi:RimJ/RimL family protein N-acetyltransferase|nr:GNAT family protein [Pseudonocardiaceae bacterium]